MHTIIKHAGIAAALALWGGCEPDPVEMPQPPEGMQAIVAAYQQPTGTVPVDSIATATQAANDRLRAVEDGPRDLVVSALQAIRRRVDDAGLSADPADEIDEDEPRITGFIDIDRICRGWNADNAVPNPDNGQLKMTALIEDGHVAPSLWGSAMACRARVDLPANASRNLYMDATFGIHLEGPAPSSIDEARFIAGFKGMVGTDAEQRSADFDFRVAFPHIEVRVPVADGDVIASVGPTGFRFRGANGTFDCTVADGVCTQVTPAPAP